MIRTFLRFVLVAFGGSVLLPTVTTVASLLHRNQDLPLADTVLPLFTAAGLTFLFWRVLLRIEQSVDADAQAQASFLDAFPERWVDLAIAGAAAMSLVLELAVIRWQGTVFEFFAFYKNFGLLTCFAGLGLGYAIANRDRIPLALVIPLFAWQFVLLIALRHGLPLWRLESLTVLPIVEQLAMGVRHAGSVSQGVAMYFLLSVVFLLTALAFVPIGQLCGRLMMRRRELGAYGLNLSGSLAGVLVMFLASALWTPPLVWYGLGFLVILLVSVPRSSTLLTGITATLAAVITLAWPVNIAWQRVYSPYQLLELGYSDRGLVLIRAAGHYYQRVHDLASPGVEQDSARRVIRDYYDFPYRLSAPADVAVVGAGAGNDVAAALRGGARRVDAIEIDPAIIAIGTRAHPERPYRDARVRTIVNDARSFLRTTDRTYDMIVYGLLDSHTLLSHASSVRLDSFVYTVEGFREARTRLNPHGVLVVSFAVLSDALGRKMYEMLREAFDGAAPAVVRANYDGAVVFIQARDGGYAVPAAALAATGFRDYAERYTNAALVVDASTDDWPFFYMPRRVYPVSYLGMIALIVLGALTLTRSFLTARPQAGDASFFLLGAGFMLVETKAITEMGLTFGNTWQVIGVVIASILGMALLGNIAVVKLKLRQPLPAYLLLLGTLLLGWYVMGRGGLPSTTPGRIATAVLLTSPLFFSGIVFSTLLAARGSVASAMAANLLGAMVGGLLEYNAMYFGFRSLSLMALGFYGLALVYHVFRPPATLAAPIAARSS